MKISKAITALALASLAFVPHVAAAEEVSQERLEADVRFLADDRLEGREAGTTGYNIAAGYVAGQFAAIGLEPAEGRTYLQSVPLGYSQMVDGSAQMSIDGTKLPTESFVAFPAIDYEGGVIEAPLVFAGYGFGDAEAAWDDFADIDLAGKIAVVVRNTPTTLGAEERAYYRSLQWDRLATQGAIGAIFLPTPTYFERLSWDGLRRFSTGSSVNWVGADGRIHNSARGLDVTAIIDEEAARALLNGQKLDFDTIVAMEKQGDVQIQPFDMDRTVRIEVATERWQDPSYNVVGILPGSDPELADEVIVVTAHLDAIGVRATDEEGDDEIVNGAMDNAVGVAAITELARQMVQEKPRRTIAFVALTAEEKGLIGADYLVRHPMLGEGRRIVANINLDMPGVNYEFSDIVAFGAERWNGFDIVRRAVEAEGLKLSPDEQPELGLFTRSDHYRFVQQGIPAIYLDTGIDGDGKEAQAAFLAEHYHGPSDDIANIRFDQLARFTRLNLAVLRGIADMEETPIWNKGDFFATRYGGEMAD